MTHNHCDASYETNDTSDEETDEEPPPLPPPRGDSLNTRLAANAADNSVKDTGKIYELFAIF